MGMFVMELTGFSVVQPRLSQPHRHFVLRGIDRLQVLVDRVLYELFQARHGVVTQDVVIVAGRVAHVLVRRLRIYKRHLLGREVSTKFKFGNRRGE